MPKMVYTVGLFTALLLAVLLGAAAKKNIIDNGTCNMICDPGILESPYQCLCDILPYDAYGTGGMVLCTNEDVYLVLGYCLTYDNSTGMIFLGTCPYISYRNVSYWYPREHVIVPQNISDLNEFMCGDLNREGLLCARCKEGYGPALYSFGLSCEKCKWYGWILYIVVEFLPITVFFFIVVAFRVKVTSPPMIVFVFFAQCVVNFVYFDSTLYSTLYYYSSGVSYILLQTLLAFYGIWNLDFFRYLLPPFCVSSSITNMHVLMFEFISAFYPLTLILITYICIELHAHNYRLIVWLWKPFHRCFVKFRRSWDIRTSMVDAFATFLLLSYTKLLFASSNLLCALYLHTFIDAPCHWNQSDLFLLYDPTMKYFSKEHIPFAVSSICVFFVFVLLPLLLLVVYPTRLFRMCCRFSHHHSLHTFVEAFQGHYKDGTNGTRDYRSFSGFYFGLRILFVLVIMYAYSNPYNTATWLLGMLSIILLAMLVITTVKPYKCECANSLDSWLIVLLIALYVFADVVRYNGGRGIHKSSVSFLVVLLSIPMVVFVIYIALKTMLKTRMGKSIARCLEVLKQRLCGGRNSGANQGELEAFPDRIVNPQLYESLDHSGRCNSRPLPVTTEECAIMAASAANPPNRGYTYGSVN